MNGRGGTRTRTSVTAHGILNPEQRALNPEENADFPKVGALWGALENEVGVIEPDLKAVILAWPGLPEPVKAGILAMVKATTID